MGAGLESADGSEFSEREHAERVRKDGWERQQTEPEMLRMTGYDQHPIPPCDSGVELGARVPDFHHSLTILGYFLASFVMRSGFTFVSTMVMSSGKRSRHSSSLRSPKLMTYR